MWLPDVGLAVIGVFILPPRTSDKSLVLSRLDRWVRTDLWRRLRWFERKRRAKVRQVAARRRLRAQGVPRLLLRLPRPRILFPSLVDRFVATLFGRVFAPVLFSGVTLLVVFG